jgi:hypothetical protein
MDLCLQVKNDLLRVGNVADGLDGILTLDMLEEFLSIVDNEKYQFVGDETLAMTSTLTNDSSLWPVMIAKKKRDEIVAASLRAMKQAMSFDENQTYLSTWLQVRDFLDSLHRIYTVPKPWSAIRQESQIMKGNAFKASILTGILPRVKYSTAGSATGRLTITKGPNFLVAPAKSRKALRASKSDSDIAIIDFTSMEPRVALMLLQHDIGNMDVYEYLMDVCDISTRPIAKLATISALYGASERSLIETVKSKSKAASVVANVKAFFDVPSLEGMLEEQARQGMVRNFFGRPLHDATKTERVRVNHYIQSTAAELAVLLFAKLCDAVPSMKPQLVIHDALIAEIPKCDIETLKTELAALQFENIKFPSTLAIV